MRGERCRFSCYPSTPELGGALKPFKKMIELTATQSPPGCSFRRHTAAGRSWQSRGPAKLPCTLRRDARSATRCLPASELVQGPARWSENLVVCQRKQAVLKPPACCQQATGRCDDAGMAELAAGATARGMRACCRPRALCSNCGC